MERVLADGDNNYTSSASFKVPSDYDFCYREKGLSTEDPNIAIGSGYRGSGGQSRSGARASSSQASESNGGASEAATHREEPHQAEAMQGVFD